MVLKGHKIKSRTQNKMTHRATNVTRSVIEYPTNRKPAKSFQENATSVFGPRLYNSLPNYLRDMRSFKTEKCKFELDKFLELDLS